MVGWACTSSSRPVPGGYLTLCPRSRPDEGSQNSPFGNIPNWEGAARHSLAGLRLDIQHTRPAWPASLVSQCLSTRPPEQSAPPGTLYQVLAEQLVVEDLHLILFCQLLAQADGLLPHLQKDGRDKGQGAPPGLQSPCHGGTW